MTAGAAGNTAVNSSGSLFALQLMQIEGRGGNQRAQEKPTSFVWLQCEHLLTQGSVLDTELEWE